MAIYRLVSDPVTRRNEMTFGLLIILAIPVMAITGW